MPKIFSPEDLEEIRKALLREGRAHFLQYGLRKTRVEELAAAVGIAKGTFYNFFSSKEELCLEIYEEEEVGIGEKIREITAESSDPAEVLTGVMQYTLAYLQGDSLLRRLRETGEFVLLGRGINKAKLTVHQNSDLELASYLTDTLRKMGGTVTVDPETMAGLLRAFTMLTFHTSEIGEEIFPGIMQFLIEAITARILDNPAGGRL